MIAMDLFNATAKNGEDIPVVIPVTDLDGNPGLSAAALTIEEKSKAHEMAYSDDPLVRAAVAIMGIEHVRALTARNHEDIIVSN